MKMNVKTGGPVSSALNRKEHSKVAQWRGALAGKALRFAVVASRFNLPVTEKLVEGAIDCLLAHGVRARDIAVFWCPGALEVPALAAHVAAGTKKFGKPDGVICVGCIIRGDTDHYQFVCTEAMRGVADLALKFSGSDKARKNSPVAITNAILTVTSPQQAIERSGKGDSNKGWEAAAAAVELANLLRAIG